MYMRHIGDKALSRDRLTSGDGSADGSPCRGGGERFVVLLSTGKAIVVMIWQLFFFHSRQNICLNQMSPLTKCDTVKWTNRSKSNDMKKDEDFFRIDVLSCTILGFFTARSLRAMANYFPTQLRGSSQVVRVESHCFNAKRSDKIVSCRGTEGGQIRVGHESLRESLKRCTYRQCCDCALVYVKQERCGNVAQAVQ